MPAHGAQFTFDDTAAFEINITAFGAELKSLNNSGGLVMSAALNDLADETSNKDILFDDLFAGLEAQANAPAPTGVAGAAPAQPTPPVPAAPVRWFLVGLEIEGFRGINNEGSPLKLSFKPDCVSSISAPNAVGKSSVYDALSFALRGKIPKLDRLLQAERPQDYYLNRFHPGGVGTVTITLEPDNGDPPATITTTRNAHGLRTVTGLAGVDANALLQSLDREFVLLDAQTFQSFIDDKALDRGRAFSGLLGLARYSTLRQQLQALSNTRAFNGHFDTTGHAAKKAAADRAIATAKSAIGADYEALVKEPIVAGTLAEQAQDHCHAALHGIPLLVDHCADRPFMSVDVDTCLAAVKTAEGDPDRERLATLIREEASWKAANKALPTDADLPELATLAEGRASALNVTAGDLLRKLYRLSEQVMTGDGWPPTVCPTCDNDDGTSVLDAVRAKLGQYDAVEATTKAVAAEWAAKGWSDLADLERLAIGQGEAPRLRQLSKAGEAGTISTDEAKELAGHVALLRQRADEKAATLATEREQLEKSLPPSLVAVTTAIEAARRLQSSWAALEKAEKESSKETARAKIVTELKSFLDGAASKFASAESGMAAARLGKIEPLCQELFGNIMFSPVVPALTKSEGGEELGIALAEFWGLENLSAQALLSESYRNAFAVSVYLAAASLYGGSPRFIVLDDITSSFDAGHQHHLVEVIRTRFSRPVKADGPQVILLSHDTMLEKLFNKHSGSAGWSHQRLEGTARTAVLLQSGAVNKVRDATIDLLNMGRVDEAAPWIRRYLEYRLHHVIDRCRIPVPLDIAFGDDKHTPGDYMKAINAAVELEHKAGTIVLDQAQIASLNLHSAAIIGNFLSHWSSCQAHAFSAPSLIGVMQAIDDYCECFKYEPLPGAPKKFYSSLNKV